MDSVEAAPGWQPEPSDAELIAAVRAGDQAAYGTLWTRHEASARRLARQIAGSADVDDLVSESFYRVLRAIGAGGGPDGAFRPYLLATLRRVHIDTGRAYRGRITVTSEDSDLDVGSVESAADLALQRDEGSAAWRAWASLPEASRTLLWHLVIDEETPAQIAPLLGTTPNAVSSRAVRAKERLRQAFLQQHVRAADSEQCAWTRRRLGEYIRNGLTERDTSAVAQHLDSCQPCRAAADDLADVNRALRAGIAPVILGGAAVAGKYLAAGKGAHPAVIATWIHHLRPRGALAISATGAGALVAGGLVTALVALNLTGGGHPGNRSPARQLAASTPAVTHPLISSNAPDPAPRPATTTPTTAATPARPSKHAASQATSARPAPSTTPSRRASAATTATAPRGGPRTVTLTLTVGRRLVVTTSPGWLVERVTGPTGTTCAPATGAAVTCTVSAPSGAPYPFTVTVTSTDPVPGYLASNASPQLVTF